MLNNVKTFALLMLTAGLALGVFAGSLIASPEEVVSGISRVDAAVESRIQHYQEKYDLDVLETDLLRHEIVRYRRQVRDELLKLWRDNQDKFDYINKKSEEKILKILGEKAKPAPEEDSDK